MKAYRLKSCAIIRHGAPRVYVRGRLNGLSDAWRAALVLARSLIARGFSDSVHYEQPTYHGVIPAKAGIHLALAIDVRYGFPPSRE